MGRMLGPTMSKTPFTEAGGDNVKGSRLDGWSYGFKTVQAQQICYKDGKVPDRVRHAMMTNAVNFAEKEFFTFGS